MAKEPREWIPPKSGLRALSELQARHQIERQQLLELIMEESRDKEDKLMAEDVVEGNTQIEFNGVSFIEVLPPEPETKGVVEGEE